MTSFRATALLGCQTLPNAGWKMSSDRKVKFTDIKSLNKEHENAKKCQNDERKRSFFKVIINQRRATSIQSRCSSRPAAVHIPFVLSIGFCSFVYMIKRTLHIGSKIWILCWWGKNNISPVGAANERDFLPREHKTFILNHREIFSCNLCVIFEPPSNIVYLNLMWIKRALAAI